MKKPPRHDVMKINVLESRPIFPKKCWPFLNIILERAADKKHLLISEDNLTVEFGFSTIEQLVDALDAARRVGVISYRRSYGALLVTLLMGINTAEQFEEYMKRPKELRN